MQEITKKKKRISVLILNLACFDAFKDGLETRLLAKKTFSEGKGLLRVQNPVRRSQTGSVWIFVFFKTGMF